MTTTSGQIKRLMSDKGFGFILADGGTEYFFHATALRGAPFDTLDVGDRVTFEATDNGAKGPRAESVELLR